MISRGTEVFEPWPHWSSPAETVGNHGREHEGKLGFSNGVKYQSIMDYDHPLYSVLYI